MTGLQTENTMLQKTVDELKRELEAVVLDAECLKDEREEIEKLLQVNSKENLSNAGKTIFLHRSLLPVIPVNISIPYIVYTSNIVDQVF